MSYLLVKGDAARIPLADQSVDLVFGSPPYVDCRTYLEDGKDLGIARKLDSWIEWMLAVTTEALRVSRGAVVWVASGKTEDRNYWPACEGLMYLWHKRGGHAYRPCYWHRNGIPGSGGDQWFRADVEYLMCFKRAGLLPWSDSTAMGHPPKYAAGGEMSHRTGGRVRNQWGGSEKSMSHTTKNGDKASHGRPSHVFSTGDARVNRRMHRPDGSVDEQAYSPPVLANPGNVLATGAAGGGHLGHALAHENEAPFPEALAEFFVRSLCQPGGLILDPFSGSGTTASVALRFGREAIGMDLRQSQARIARQRIERPHQPVGKAHKQRESVGPLFDIQEGAAK